MVGLGALPGGDYFYSHAFGISADGFVVVVRSISTSGFEAFRWTSAEGMVGLGDFPGGGFQSIAYSASADGSVIVGRSESASGTEAFRWTRGLGMVGLGDFPGGDFFSWAYGVSADGSVVVGMSKSASEGEAFIWDATNGMRKLRDVLDDLLLPASRAALDGWSLQNAIAISSDGRTVVGWGISPSGKGAPWLAFLGTEVPEPTSWLLLVIGFTFALAARRAVPSR
jgi:probable HAF family extracellular repeat protein